MKRIFIAPWLALVFGACGVSHAPTDGGASLDAPAADSSIDAGSDCVPGSSRTVACANCGVATQHCDPRGVWADRGECLGSRSCEPGASETQSTSACGSRLRTCDDRCEWSGWEQTLPDGECTPGEERRDETACGPSEVEVATCTDECEWTAPTCVELCGPGRRTSPPDAEEICIPAGPFIRGWEELENARPVREVMMSAYFIDRYPVTNERYQACVDAGACTVPEDAVGRDSLADPTRSRYPVQAIDSSQALAFCAWDGDRGLPTEAQWEKAARGPAPRAQAYTWDGAFDCSRVRCMSTLGQELPLEVDALPNVTSYYGAEMLIGGGFERVSDTYSNTYYASDDSLSDPEGPPVEGTRACRGRPVGLNSALAYNVSQRQTCSDFFPPTHAVFRCARRALSME